MCTSKIKVFGTCPQPLILNRMKSSKSTHTQKLFCATTSCILKTDQTCYTYHKNQHWLGDSSVRTSFFDLLCTFVKYPCQATQQPCSEEYWGFMPPVDLKFLSNCTRSQSAACKHSHCHQILQTTNRHQVIKLCKQTGLSQQQINTSPCLVFVEFDKPPTLPLPHSCYVCPQPSSSFILPFTQFPKEGIHC